MGDLTKNFSKTEFRCKCGCSQDSIDSDLVIILQAVRESVGSAIVISSGVRCDNYNAEVNGVPESSHVFGTAVDIVCESSKLRFAIIAASVAAGIKRIGIADRFIHLDTSLNKNQLVMWTYK